MPEGGPSAADVRDAEAWFGANGLPYFVDRTRARVRRGLRPSRVLAVVLLGVLAGALVAWWAGRTTVLLSVQLSSGLQALLVVLALYAWTALGAGAVTGWAARQAVGGLGLLFPLVTRALPSCCCSSPSCSSTPRCGWWPSASTAG